VEDDLAVVHPNAASAGPDGTIYFIGHVLETEASGRQMTGLPADLVLEQEPDYKKQIHAGGTYTLRLLIYRPPAGEGGAP
jgi:hypothetical protein